VKCLEFRDGKRCLAALALRGKPEAWLPMASVPASSALPLDAAASPEQDSAKHFFITDGELLCTYCFT